MKSSSLSRAFELAKLAAQVGLKEARSGDFQSRVEQAMLIAQSLSKLKGAAMKAGQILSLDLDSYFPPEAIQILSQLQNAAVAHPFSEINQIILTEVNSTEQTKLTDLSDRPIGVASIGQVHRAKYDNKDIVIKVQFEGVADSIDSDLKILKTLASSICQITGRKMNLDPLFAEFRSILVQELDYEKEADFQELFAKKVSSLNSNPKVRFRVPTVIESLSGKRVLAMSFEQGLILRDWLQTKPDPEQRKAVAIAMLDLYFHEFFDWGLVQTDPNWGNFLVDVKDGKINICLLDFGATRRYSRDFVLNYIRLLDLTAQKDSQALRKQAIDFGLIDARESEEAFSALEKMLQTAIKPFFVEKDGVSVFDFADPNHALESQQAAKFLAQKLVYSPPPYSLIFLHRKLAGVYSILKALNVKLDISLYWQMMKDLSARKV